MGLDEILRRTQARIGDRQVAAKLVHHGGDLAAEDHDRNEALACDVGEIFRNDGRH